MMQQQQLYQQQQTLQNQLMQQQQAMSNLPVGNPFLMSQPAGNHNPFMQNGQMPMMQPQQPMGYQTGMPIHPPPQQQQQQEFGNVNLVKTGNTIDPFANLAASRSNNTQVFLLFL
jgi:hypothetical protein